MTTSTIPFVIQAANRWESGTTGHRAMQRTRTWYAAMAIRLRCAAAQHPRAGQRDYLARQAEIADRQVRFLDAQAAHR